MGLSAELVKIQPGSSVEAQPPGSRIYYLRCPIQASPRVIASGPYILNYVYLSLTLRGKLTFC